MSTAELDHLTLRTEGAIGYLTLNRPEARNALVLASMNELIAAAAWFDDQPDVKVVVVTGAGDSFCAGADLSVLAAVLGRDPGPEELEAADLGRRMLEAVAGMSAITVVGIHGHCVGGGFALAACCDLRVAVAGTAFSIPEVGLGIPLGWGATPRLVRELGSAMAIDLIATGRVADAAELLQRGFVNRVASQDEFETTLHDLAETLAAKPAYALRVTKQQIGAAAENLATTEGSELDANRLLAALSDPESVAAARTYLSRFDRNAEP